MRRSRELFPQFGKVEIEHASYGRIGMTSDHLPRLHAVGENLIILTGFNGRGIAAGTLFGHELLVTCPGSCARTRCSFPSRRSRTPRCEPSTKAR
ncbi:FAD-dependent oxidoreductase [Sinorhizobium meliloti]|uniref:FAD-dependent oxidoreductase n=1 Tax=Rhizobium meliloti TaxID=382 RepID=UPI003B519B3C